MGVCGRVLLLDNPHYHHLFYRSLLQLLAEAQVTRIAQTRNDIFVRVQYRVYRSNPQINILGVGVLQNIVDTFGAAKYRHHMCMCRLAAVCAECLVGSHHRSTRGEHRVAQD